MILAKRHLRDMFTGCIVSLAIMLLIDKTFLITPQTQLTQSYDVNHHTDRIGIGKIPLDDAKTSKEHNEVSDGIQPRVVHKDSKTLSKTIKSNSIHQFDQKTVGSLPTAELGGKTLAQNQIDQTALGKMSGSEDVATMEENMTRDFSPSEDDPFQVFMTKSKVCPLHVSRAYASNDPSSSALQDMEWCESSRATYNVVIGRSWGGLPPPKRKEWDTRSCNDLLKLGKLQTCDERYGWSFNRDWLRNMRVIVSGQSSVKCATNLKTTAYCQTRNVVVDFSKARPSGLTRSFGEGFLESYGNRVPGEGLKHISGNDIDMRCDVTENRPTFVLSNDDIYNLGHYINDVMMVWNMVTLANKSPKDSILINIDGIREGGPAGGPAHRLMEPSDPDRHGPYVGYFKSWFQELKRGVDYGNRRVCFKEIYFQPTPGVPWFWNDWGIVNKCSVGSSSPLYQSFNIFLRQYWRQSYGSNSLPEPDTDKVHLVIEVRKINPAKSNNHSSARYIRNLQALRALIESTVPGVRITAQDFASLSFDKQVALSHSAGIFMSMHGAGTTHIFHAAIGSPNCCALVELFPDETIEFHTAHGYGNLARMLGFHHYRYVASKGRTTSLGTEVDITAIRDLVAKAVNDVRGKPTCLHNVKDTSKPIYPNNAFDQFRPQD